MLCPRTHPAQELAELYHQRWEIELGFREIKQTLQEGEPVLRSKQPALVRQELWGVLIAYTLLRRLHIRPVDQAAVGNQTDRHRFEPRRVANHDHLVDDFCKGLAARRFAIA